MVLTLRTLSLNELPVTPPLVAQFDVRGGSIGRADHNTFALPDPEHIISRIQAEISQGADLRFSITNVSRANPIIVAGQPLGHGESAVLNHRDVIRIGGYALEADLPPDDNRTVIHTPAPRHAPVPPAPVPAPAPGPVATPAPVRAAPAPLLDDPFADLMPPAASNSGRLAAAAPPPQPAPRLSSDFDPFGLGPSPAPAAPKPDPLADLGTPAGPSGSIDDIFGLAPATDGAMRQFLADPPPPSIPPSPPPTPAPPRSVMPPPAPVMPAASAATHPAPAPRPVPAAPGAAGSFDDLLGPAFGDDPGWPGLGPTPAPATPLASPAPTPVAAPAATPVAAPVMPAASESAAAVPAGTAPPVAPAPAAAARPAQPFIKAPPVASLPPARQVPVTDAARTTATPAGTDPLWAAFCHGAGLPVGHQVQTLTPELMALIGQLLRTAIEGAHRLVAIRAAARYEMHAQVTMIRARNNNPLKFAPDGAAALEQLLQPPARGFLAGPEAVTDAMNDLIGHSIGTMAGMRSALEGVLDRFTPAELEAKLGSGAVLDRLLPMSRKSRLWELYLQHYQQIRQEASDDFDALFGKAFLDAYEQQLEQLRQSAPDSDPPARP